MTGAIFLDQGYRVATRVFIQNIGDLADWTDENHKGRLQEVAQERTGLPPVYRVTAEGGPGHNRSYAAEAVVGGSVVGTGRGPTKQAAQQAAARAALDSLAKAPPTPPPAPPAPLARRRETSPRSRRASAAGSPRSPPTGAPPRDPAATGAPPPRSRARMRPAGAAAASWPRSAPPPTSSSGAGGTSPSPSRLRRRRASAPGAATAEAAGAAPGPARRRHTTDMSGRSCGPAMSRPPYVDVGPCMPGESTG